MEDEHLYGFIEAVDHELSSTSNGLSGHAGYFSFATAGKPSLDYTVGAVLLCLLWYQVTLWRYQNWFKGKVESFSIATNHFSLPRGLLENSSELNGCHGQLLHFFLTPVLIHLIHRRYFMMEIPPYSLLSFFLFCNVNCLWFVPQIFRLC